MKNLAAEGKSILFITHKLAEIMQVADRCSVLRKGKYIGTVDIKDTTPEKLSAMMVGRDVLQSIVQHQPMLVPVFGDMAHAHDGQPLADGHIGTPGRAYCW